MTCKWLAISPRVGPVLTMIEAANFVRNAAALGFSHYSGVPCSYLKPLINQVIDADACTYVGAANEGDAVAIASGAAIAGQRAIAMMQNSGLGNAVSPLTSLNWVFQLPILLIITLRGDPAHGDEPQHELMGQITTGLLDHMQIPWRPFPESEQDIEASLMAATKSLDQTGRPFALVLRKGSVASAPLKQNGLSSRPAHRYATVDNRCPGKPGPTRRQVLETVQQLTTSEDVLIATTGFAGRELYALDDRPNQLYVVGSMGCASSLALGLSLALPNRRVLLLDGDGAALMRLGNLATIGQHAGPNYVHILLDNEQHESTGGQATVSAGIDFAHLATSCGYSAAICGDNTELLPSLLELKLDGPRMAHLKISAGTANDLPRPNISPPEVLLRLKKHLGVTK